MRAEEHRYVLHKLQFNDPKRHNSHNTIYLSSFWFDVAFWRKNAEFAAFPLLLAAKNTTKKIGLLTILPPRRWNGRISKKVWNATNFLLPYSSIAALLLLFVLSSLFASFHFNHSDSMTHPYLSSISFFKADRDDFGFRFRCAIIWCKLVRLSYDSIRPCRTHSATISRETHGCTCTCTERHERLTIIILILLCTLVYPCVSGKVCKS